MIVQEPERTYYALIVGDVEHERHVHQFKYVWEDGNWTFERVINTPRQYDEQGRITRPEGVLTLGVLQVNGMPVYRWRPIETKRARPI